MLLYRGAAPFCTATKDKGPVCYSPCLWEGDGGFELLQQAAPGERVSLLLGRAGC